jgi:S-adenosylmethionine:tRNA ribosyltransferase-isomerase
VAVGTTSVRALEGVAALRGGGIEAHAGWIGRVIRPGHDFQIVSGLITNFHLPGSTLLMLVSALAGRERVLAAYREAIDRGYSFFSYGDAMLLIRT